MNNSIELDLQKTVADNGFAIVEQVLTGQTIEALIQAIALAQKSMFAKHRSGSMYAMRNVLKAIPAIQALASSPRISSLASAVLGINAYPIKAILFDKTAKANWKVAWHQDLTIAVAAKKPVAGFGPWSEKAGIPHVQPPVEILENLLTLRIHLDDCNADNGALKVIPKSHLDGKLDSETIHSLKQTGNVHVCTAKAGDVLVMRPLLLHSSSPAVQPSHRRVLHVEYSALNLPGGLKWANSQENVAISS